MSSDQPEARAKAFDIIKRKSFVRGDITLSSGKKSGHYFDMKPAMFDPEGANALSDLILEKIAPVGVDYVGGLEMGAVPLISPINIKSLHAGRAIAGFFVRKTAKEHGTRRQIEGAGDLHGKIVVIVEDVTTTGKSAMAAVEAVRGAGASVSLVISIVDRQEGAEALFREAGVPFQSLFTADDFLES